MNMDNKDLAAVLWALRLMQTKLEHEAFDGKSLIEVQDDLEHLIKHIEEHFENVEAA